VVLKVALAVDAGESIIRSAIDHGAELLIVHHGLFWGQEQALSGPLGYKIALLMQNGLSLYTSHLPLDGHMTLGNNVELARFFGATDIEPFFEHQGSFIGCRARYPAPRSLDEITTRARKLVANTPSEKNGLPLVFPFGPKMVSTVGFLSGSGSSGLEAVVGAGMDLLISGEAKHGVYHASKELRANAIFCGHYQTETFGVKALGQDLRRVFGIEPIFIDEDSGV
jgi:dinuclear metal center YbgI/SA1388 family protein